MSLHQESLSIVLKRSTVLAALLLVFGISTQASAVSTFTETFSAGNSNWGDVASAPATHVTSGGPAGAGDGYITATQTIDNTFEATVFRGQANLGSSSGAFIGDWESDKVVKVSFDIRHTAPEPLSTFMRISTPGNFPAYVALSFAPIAPFTWTHVEIPVIEGSPNLVSEGAGFGFTYSDTFGSVGNVQVGLGALTGSTLGDTSVTFDLDNVGIAAIVPEPTSVCLLGMAAVAGLSVRRRK